MKRATIVAMCAALGTGPLAGQQEDAGPRRVTLGEAVQVALRDNPRVTRAQANVHMAEFDRLNAWGDFLPNVNLGYGFSDASTGRLDPTGQSITTTSWTLQLGASVDIFDGLRRFNGLEGAQESLEAEQARRRQTRYETILAVNRAFYNAVANRELVRVEEDRVERQRQQLELVRQQVALGRATRSDLLRSRIDLNDARLALLNAENDARAATFALAEAMGVRERVSPVEEATLEVDSIPWERDELMSRALERGPSVASARAAAEAARADVASARSAYLPSLTLSGGWAWQNTDFPPENRSWGISIEGSLPLFDGFERENRVYRARAQADAAEAQERGAELEIRSRVDEAYSQVQAALSGVELARQSEELAREDLRLTRERYRLGLATILDLQAAQITLRQAEADLVQRRFDYRIGIAQLEAVIGTRLALRGTPAAPEGESAAREAAGATEHEAAWSEG